MMPVPTPPPAALYSIFQRPSQQQHPQQQKPLPTEVPAAVASPQQPQHQHQQRQRREQAHASTITTPDRALTAADSVLYSPPRNHPPLSGGINRGVAHDSIPHERMSPSNHTLGPQPTKTPLSTILPLTPVCTTSSAEVPSKDNALPHPPSHASDSGGDSTIIPTTTTTTTTSANTMTSSSKKRKASVTERTVSNSSEGSDLSSLPEDHLLHHVLIPTLSDNAAGEGYVLSVSANMKKKRALATHHLKEDHDPHHDNPTKKETSLVKDKAKATPTKPQRRAAPTATSSSSKPARSRAAQVEQGPESAPQKRVLPSRGGMLRDKGVMPLDSSLLGLSQDLPLVPAGEYILCRARDPRILERTIHDPNRVPPSTYGAIEQPASDPVPSSSSTPPGLPPKPLVHIEVPIFKPCSINQYLQEEKKRKLQLLTKALAKAEAQAAAEALVTNATHDSNASLTVSKTRVVSTRQKHKDIASHQVVSVLTGSAGHGKKATHTVAGGVGSVSSGGSGGSSSKKDGSAVEEDLSDEVYEKRHRKQEMAEKKVKNREKEKLRHAMYQQQLVVEKLRHMEINRLMPISAFRSLQKTLSQDAVLSRESTGSSSQEETTAAQAPLSLAAARIMQDEYHRRLLREAEENLRRYEQLGLGGETHMSTYSPFSRTKNRLLAMAALRTEQDSAAQKSLVTSHGSRGHAVVHERREKALHQRSESTSSHSKAASGEGRRKRAKTGDTAFEGEGQTRTKVKTPLSTPPGSAKATSGPTFSLTLANNPPPTSQRTPSRKSSTLSSTSSSSASTITLPRVVENRPPKPITTFIKPGSILASGARKSSRVALAFGEKVPQLERIDFELPLDSFGAMIRGRMGESEPVLKGGSSTLQGVGHPDIMTKIQDSAPSLTGAAKEGEGKDSLAAPSTTHSSLPLASISSSSSSSVTSSISSSASS